MELVVGEKVSFPLLIKSQLGKLFQIHIAENGLKYLKYLWGIKMMKILSTRIFYHSQGGVEKEFRKY